MLSDSSYPICGYYVPYWGVISILVMTFLLLGIQGLIISLAFFGLNYIYTSSDGGSDVTTATTSSGYQVCTLPTQVFTFDEMIVLLCINSITLVLASVA